MLAEHEMLVINNIGLVTHMAHKYANTPYDLDDLISVGRVGLTKAAYHFNHTRGFKFSTYAARCITNEIFIYFRKNKKHLGCLSLDSKIHTDKEGRELKLSDMIADDKHVDDDIMRICEISQLRELLETVLTDKEREVIRLRYGINGYGEHSQGEVAKLVGYSQSYVSRIEKIALEKLKMHWKE